MWYQFILQNAHFALHLFMAIVFFAVSWLYFDAWLEKKRLPEASLVLGFFLLSSSLAIQATQIESNILTISSLSSQLLTTAGYVSRFIGYILVIFGLFMSGIQERKLETSIALFPWNMTLPLGMSVMEIVRIMFPFQALCVTLLYMRKAFWGLEAHLRPVAYAILLLTISEFLAVCALWRDTTNVQLYQLLAPFGTIWLASHLFLLLSSVMLGKWVFDYLLKQFKAQLFFIITVIVLSVFLTTTVSFTGLLLQNIQSESLNQLKADVKVLQFAIDGKRNESKSDVILISKDQQVVQDLLSKNREDLGKAAQEYLITKKYSTLAFFDEQGQVLTRGEDLEKVGDSLTSNSLVRRALRGETTSSLVIQDGVLSALLSMSASAPIISDGKVIGGVVIGTHIDNAFVDGIKKATDLDASIYAGNTLSATTILTGDGKTRLVGIKEENQDIKRVVLTQAQGLSVSLDVANTPYLAAYQPLQDVEGVTLGMISVSRPQSGVLQTAGRSIELTFLVGIVILTILVVPVYLTARYISNQL